MGTYPRSRLLLTALLVGGAWRCDPADVTERPGREADAPLVANRERAAKLDSAARYLRRGRIYMQESAFIRAISQLEQSVRLNPESAEARSMLGLSYAMRLNAGKAIEHIERAIALEPENGEHYMLLGKAHMLLTDDDGARAAYERAIELGLKRGKPYYDLGIISDRENRLDDARAFFEKAVETAPQLAPSCDLRLGIIAEKEGDASRAIDLYERALRGDSDLTTAHYRIAKLYLEAGRDSLAQSHLREFQRLKAAEVEAEARGG